MRLKTLTLSILVLAVVSAVVFIARRPAPPPSKDPRTGQALVDATTIEKAARLRLSDAGKTVLLSRQADGTWRDASYFDLPADMAKLSSFVGSLTEAKLQRLVTANPERVARLEFKDTRIELLDAADKPLWSVTLGKNADLGGGRFVRFGEETKAYLTNLNAWLDADAKNWASAELLALKPDDVAKVEIAFAPPADDGAAAKPATVTLTRAKKDDAWKAEPTPAQQQVKAARVGALLSSLTALRFTDTVEPNDAQVAVAKANQRVAKLTAFDGKTYTIALGRKPEEKKLKAPVASSDGKTGPASMGSITDLAKKDQPAGNEAGKDKPAAPEFETIPAGPVFAFVTSSEASAPVNALMAKRAYQISDYTFTSLPQSADELFEPRPATPAPAADQKPAVPPAK
ncbi:DUF4340 domain-containing protein [Opitutus sp. ER46]|uniref:DUF4340 domain-containing protein n=1 Tax=Opitutus sp. ER46 TaxID=2161864 RepID=UPI000D31BEBA|nr:DUF4340 domain-containing protein [Opitutus sp. ER46]PTX96671.1 hypothetical protein DB354_08435 [Opitutus sp. ER46]